MSLSHVGQKFDSKSLPNRSIDVQTKSTCPVKQHSCLRSPHCNSEWNKIGCIEMYRLKSVDARISFLKNLKSCIKCGRKYSRMHKCRNYRKLDAAMCMNLHCEVPAALCKAHIKDGNATLELRGWLSTSNVRP